MWGSLKILFFSMLFSMLATGEVGAKLQLSSTEVKSAYVFNFIQYLGWPNEDVVAELQIGFYGDDGDYWQALTRMNGRKVRGKTIRITRLRSLSQASRLQVLVLGGGRNKELPEIAKKLSGKGVLLVTDNALEKQNTMLNFVYPAKNRLSFELNRYNIVYERIRVSPEILVLGGTELDVAKVLKELEESLKESRLELAKQTNTLDSLTKKIQQREQLLRKQQSKIDKQNQSLSQQKLKLTKQDGKLKASKSAFEKMEEEYKQLSIDLGKSQEKFNSNNTALVEMQEVMGEKQRSIERLSGLIEDKKNELAQQVTVLESQEVEIKEKENEISEQLVAMHKQSSTIRTQYGILIMAALGFALVLLLIMVIYASNRMKQKANQELQVKNQQLADVNDQLKNAHSQLVESEKMAALGGLVAGVAHEINTPLGVGVTAASHLSDRIAIFDKEYKSGSLRRSALEELLEDAKQSTDMLSRNLGRASELIRNFKQVAVDQSNESRRKFELGGYLEEIIRSLHPQFKKGKHHISIEADQSITVDTYPGVLAQVMTNLMMNSVVHGFADMAGGEISIQIELVGDKVMMAYRDNGVGMTPEQQARVFEPFYTTKRASGGSGLGMSISYNLIVNKLGGTIQCLDSQEGVLFKITFLQVAD